MTSATAHQIWLGSVVSVFAIGWLAKRFGNWGQGADLAFGAIFLITSIGGGAAVLVHRMLAAQASTWPAANAAERSTLCPLCGFDLRGSTSRCPECGERISSIDRALDAVKLREDWPATPIEPREPAAGEGQLAVWRAPNSIAAQQLVDQLAARGIHARVEAREWAIAYHRAPSGADFMVIVWSDDIERAEAIITRLARDAE